MPLLWPQVDLMVARVVQAVAVKAVLVSSVVPCARRVEGHARPELRHFLRLGPEELLKDLGLDLI